MSVPIRTARVIANDRLRPLAVSPVYAPPVPFAPRPVPQIRHVRLAPVQHRRDFSWAAIIAVFLLGMMIVLLGAIAGAVLWFTYDTPDITMPAGPSIAAARLVQPARQAMLMPVSPVVAAPADIVLPAENAAPAANGAAAVSPVQTAGDAQIVIRENGSVALDDLLDSAHSRLEEGENAVALTLYERVLAVEPGNRDALEGKAYALGRLAALPGGPPAVFTALQRMEKILPEDAALQAALGSIILAQCGKDADAIDHLERATRLAPGDVNIRFDLAILYDRAGKMPEALTLYRQILRRAWESDTDILPQETLDTIRRRAAYLAVTRIQP